MISYEAYCKIHNLSTQAGLKPSQIAREMNMDERTVLSWLAEEQYRQRKSTPRGSKLDPFKGDIARWLETYPYTAQQIYQRLMEAGFDGRYTIVKEYVRKIRPKKRNAYLTLSFAPGECAQVDWGSWGSVVVGDNASRRLSFFAMVLCYSRMLYVEFTTLQTMEHFLGCHQRAFEFFGGVPARVMVDNLKSAVLNNYIGRAPVLNPKYADFSAHYGFAVSPCNVRSPHEKGRVENAVGYVKKNLLAGLEIPCFDALAPITQNWLDTVANTRVHGVTRTVPTKALSVELPHLKALPVHPYDIATVKQVRPSSQFRVSVDSNKYSVPAVCAGKELTLKQYPDRLCFYDGEQLVARHLRTCDKHQDILNPDHEKPLLEQRKKARHQLMYGRFLSLSPRAQDYYRELDSRCMNAFHHIQKIVALAEIYGEDAVFRAMEDAFEYKAFSCEYIANILEQRGRYRQKAGPLHLQRNEDMLEISLQQPDLSIYDIHKEA